MADEPEPLSKKTIMAWRAFTATNEFNAGILHLKERHAPVVTGKTAVELLELSMKWGAYFEALNDITDVLCKIPQVDDSAEDKGLE